MISTQFDADDRLEPSRQALLSELHATEPSEPFIAVLGHDLRNPLLSLTWGRSSPAKHPLPERAAPSVERMQRNGERMTAFISNILAFDNGKLVGGVRVMR